MIMLDATWQHFLVVTASVAIETFAWQDDF
jgi:hypothetical protein